MACVRGRPLRQVQEFHVYNYSTCISLPDDAKGISIIYSPTSKAVMACFEYDNNSGRPSISRQFQMFMSWQEIPYNARYCGTATDPGVPQFNGEQYPTLWHVYELK